MVYPIFTLTRYNFNYQWPIELEFYWNKMLRILPLKHSMSTGLHPPNISYRTVQPITLKTFSPHTSNYTGFKSVLNEIQQKYGVVFRSIKVISKLEGFVPHVFPLLSQFPVAK